MQKKIVRNHTLDRTYPVPQQFCNVTLTKNKPGNGLVSFLFLRMCEEGRVISLEGDAVL